MVAYATVDELESFLEDDPMPRHPERLLDRATERIRELLGGYLYDVGEDGFATDARVRHDIMMMTLLQAQYMMDLGDETGAKDGFSSMSTGSVSWTRRSGSGGGNAPTPKFGPNVLAYLNQTSMRFGAWRQ